MPEKQEEGGRAARYLGAGLAAAAGGYALSRRPWQSAKPMFAGADGGISRAITSHRAQALRGPAKTLPGKVRDYLVYGTKDTYRVPTQWDNLKSPKRIKGMLYGEDPDITQWVKGEENVGMRRPGVNLEDKLVEARAFARKGKSPLPSTKGVHEVVGRRKVKDAAHLQATLRERFGKKYVVKLREAAQTGRNVITEKDDLRAILRERNSIRRAGVAHGGRTLRGKEIDQLAFKNGDEHSALLARHPALSKGDVVHAVMRKHDAAIIQKRMSLKRQGAVRQAANRALGQNSGDTHEVRVHAIGGKVLRSTTVPRYDTVGQLLQTVGWKSRETRRAEDFAERALKQLPERHKKNVSFGMDVGVGEKGQMRLIESNAGGEHGTLIAPRTGGRAHRAWADFGTAVQSHRLMSELQGKNTHALSAARGLAVGGAAVTGLAGYDATKHFSKKKDRS